MTFVLISPQLDQVQGVQFESDCLLWPVACYNVALFPEYQTQGSEIKRKTILSDMLTFLTPPSSVRHTSPCACRSSTSRSVQDQSRDTSGSSRWFIQINSLVASLMKATKLFNWLMRSTELFCKTQNLHLINKPQECGFESVMNLNKCHCCTI